MSGNYSSQHVCIKCLYIYVHLHGSIIHVKYFICIPGYTYPVKQFFLEDILQETNYVLEEDSSYAKHSSNKWSENLSIELELADIKTGEVIANPKTLDSNLTIRQLFHRYKSKLLLNVHHNF